MESQLENDVNEAASKFDEISIRDLQSKHRKERKDLQAKIQAIKANAPKSDKRKRKLALEEIAKLEVKLEDKQKMEIKLTENKIKSEHTLDAHANDNYKDCENAINNESTEDTQPEQRITKAQKRRDKKIRESQKREQEIKAMEKDFIYAPKAEEDRKLKLKLNERQLALFYIPSDGHCLYNAIRHQLFQNGLSNLSIKELRCKTADYIKANKESLIPYMSLSETGDLLTDDDFERYCEDIRNTSCWGGQIELKALSCILEKPIEILQADGSPTVQGTEFSGDPLVITYHRHMYKLGEHYNSTIPLSEVSKNDDNKENFDN